MLWTKQKKMKKLKILKKALRVKLVSKKNCKKTDPWKMFPSAVKFSQSDVRSCIITCRTEEIQFLWSWCYDGWKQTSASKCFTSYTYCCFISQTRHPQIFLFSMTTGNHRVRLIWDTWTYRYTTMEASKVLQLWLF